MYGCAMLRTAEVPHADALTEWDASRMIWGAERTRTTRTKAHGRRKSMAGQHRQPPPNHWKPGSRAEGAMQQIQRLQAAQA